MLQKMQTELFYEKNSTKYMLTQYCVGRDTYIDACSHLHILTSSYTRLYIQTHTYAHTYTHTPTHIHIYIYAMECTIILMYIVWNLKQFLIYSDTNTTMILIQVIWVKSFKCYK